MAAKVEAPFGVGAVSRSRRRGQQVLHHAQISSGKETKEYRATKRNYVTLIDTLGKTVDPGHFARRLEEKSLISDEIVQVASVVGVLTPSQRIAPVMNAVLAQICLKANHFHTFMDVLMIGNSDLRDLILLDYSSSLELNAMEVVAGVSDWEELGCQLGVSPVKIAQLVEDGRGSEYCREEMVQEWLRENKTASWEKLCEALERMGNEAEVQIINEHYLHVSSHDHPPEFHDTKAQECLKHWRVYAGVTVLALILVLILVVNYDWPLAKESAKPDPKAIIEGDLRLVGGNRCEGRLQVAVLDQKSTTNSLQWSTACDKYFGTKEIRIACKQLGCPTGDPRRQSISRFGGRPRSSHNYQAFGFTCSGQENKVINCPYTGADCDIRDRRIDDIIGISCKDGDEFEPTTVAAPQPPGGPAEGELRLAGGPNACEGRLEIYVPFLGKWAQAVYRDFGTKEVQVTCRELGCGDRGERMSASSDSGPYQEVGYRCNGDEEMLRDCEAIAVFSRGAEHYIGLRCGA